VKDWTKRRTNVLDADAGTLQRLHREAALVADVSAVSTSATRRCRQTDRCQDQVPGFQVHADQQTSRAGLTTCPRSVTEQCVNITVRTGWPCGL